jgi:hypothetical protein
MEETMAEPKTKRTGESVAAFVDRIADPKRRADCLAVLDLMKEVTGAEPEMWGGSMVGFGRYRYRYASGREGEWSLTGFAPRKSDLTIYVMTGFEPFGELMRQLGKYKTGKSCLYVKKLEDVDLAVLKSLLARSVQSLAAKRVEG